MKKILLLNNDYQIPQAALKFAINIAKEEGATIVGLFIQSLKYNDEQSYAFPSDINLTAVDYTLATDEQEHLRFIRTTIKLFEDECIREQVHHKSYIVADHFLDTLVDHSAFADIVICDADIPPAEYSITTFLAHTHCPVVLVNRDYAQTDTIVLTYDDKSSSIHAVKQFTYLFRWYKNLPVHFVSVLPHNIIGVEYEDLIKEWLPLHYPKADIKILKGETKEELSKYN